MNEYISHIVQIAVQVATSPYSVISILFISKTFRLTAASLMQLGVFALVALVMGASRKEVKDQIMDHWAATAAAAGTHSRKRVSRGHRPLLSGPRGQRSRSKARKKGKN